MSPVRHNIWKIYVGEFLGEVLFMAAVIVPFLGGTGLTMQEILTTEAFFAGALFLLEIPTGYFADVIGRKHSIVIGTVFLIIGTGMYAVSSTFGGFLIGAIFWGIGVSFNSGAEEALLYESLQAIGRENDYKKMMGNVFFVGRMASIVGSISGGLLAAVSLRLPAYATVASVIIWLPIALTLTETRHKQEEQETWKHFLRIFKESILENAVLRTFILFAAITIFFNIEFWLKQRYLESVAVPLASFGIIFAGVSLSSGLGGKFAQQIENAIGQKRSLALIALAPLVVWLSLAFAHSAWVIPLFFVVPALWGFSEPLFSDFLQRLVTSDRRATVLSVVNCLRRGLFFIFVPFLGWVSDVLSIQHAFAAMALIALIWAMGTLMMLRRAGVI